MTAIYFNKKPIQTTTPTIPLKELPPQKIGRIWAEMQEHIQHSMLQSNKPIKSLLERLGVSKTDKDAQRALIPIIQKICLNQQQITIEPLDDDFESGVYFLSDKGQKFAVFKVGEKRACMELLARDIAHKIGLEQHAVPGLFCSIKNPAFPSEQPLAIELWNGNNKIFQNNGEPYSNSSYEQSAQDDNEGLQHPPTLTGILEPYLPEKKKATVSDFAKMTAYALTIGLRDGKLSGIANNTFFDVEECMPKRLHPDSSPNKHVAATHLPYADDPLANQPIPKAIVWELFQQFYSLNVDDFLNKLELKKIAFPDLAAEHQKDSNNKLEDDENFGWDHGGFYITNTNAHSITGALHDKVYLKTGNPDSFRLLSEQQLNACEERVRRLREFLYTTVTREETITSRDLIRNVDLLYNAHEKALNSVGYNRLPPGNIVGRVPPTGIITNSPNPIPSVQISNSDQKRLAAVSPRPANPKSSRRLF